MSDLTINEMLQTLKKDSENGNEGENKQPDVKNKSGKKLTYRE